MRRFLKIAFLLGASFAFFFLLASIASAAAQCQEPYTGYLGCFQTAEDCSIEGGTYPIYAQDSGCYACYTGCTSSDSEAPPPPSPPPSECPRAPADPTGYAAKSSETEYSCKSNTCGGDFLSRTKTETCKANYTPQKNEAGCTVGWELASYTDCSTSFSTPAPQSCGSYQTCNGPAEWDTNYPCQCNGACYPAPDLKSIDDSSLSPQNVFEDAGKTKVKLPVNVGVTDSLENDEKMKAQSCGIDSYRYEFSGSSSSAIENGESSIVPQSCSLNPNAAYGLTAKACLEENCGKESKPLSFSTSSAPELKSPYDPDFEQSKNAFAAQPVQLEWCNNGSSGAKSYSLSVFQQKGNLWDLLFPWESAISEPFYKDQNQLQILQNDLAYAWEVSLCSDKDGKNCGIKSQRWTFVPGSKLSSPTLLVPSYNTQSPENIPTVNLSQNLNWRPGDSYATHYLIHIEGGSAAKELSKNYFSINISYPFSRLWGDLDFDAQYAWKVAGCSGGDLSRCENQGPWSETWKFKTTGAPPTGLATKPNEAGKTAIPATLFWNSMPGALSYAWETGSNSGVVINPEARVDSLLQSINYSWRVKTCADALGKACGNWSSGAFTTATLTAPQITSPQKDKEEIIPNANLSWNPVFSGNFYAYDVQYLTAPENETSSCKSLSGSRVDQNSISQNSMRVAVRCTGQYQLKVSACIDSECKIKGPESTQLFSVKEPDAAQGGLVPCGRSANDTSTAWDDRESCQLKHVFLLFRNILDFVLWKLTLVAVIFYAIATGVILYTSFGGVDVLLRIKTMWKAVGVGVLIMLLAWVFLNVLLGLLGFNVNIFGHWYELKT